MPESTKNDPTDRGTKPLSANSATLLCVESTIVGSNIIVYSQIEEDSRKSDDLIGSLTLCRSCAQTKVFLLYWQLR